MAPAPTLAGIVLILVMAAASPGSCEPAATTQSTTTPNPASALCIKNGATIAMQAQPNGSQRGVCVFPNGTRIDEWAYFRNKHRTR